MTRLHIATAGWTIPRAVAQAFPTDGSGLQRYAARFDAVEINSTFYRSHRPATYARWVETTPADFRFAVKLPRRITHEARLKDAAEPLAAFRAETEQLGDKLGPLLVQLPPSLAYEVEVAEAFFVALRDVWPGAAVCEPRHPTWFAADADERLKAHRIARVAADPARHPLAAAPGGWPELAYWRLHGSPRMYYSAYEGAALDALARAIEASGAAEAWCVFDNTTSGAAMANALGLQARLAPELTPRRGR
ncbi:DUF72 domain-containing protein [Phenylobacterium sp. VNQ135]|uniref:DUF72 domain-containing protein n=1 Tax=Phenylobacterium sp. VNQ135 TaxID=3400922 RepID=UPI003BFBBF87